MVWPTLGSRTAKDQEQEQEQDFSRPTDASLPPRQRDTRPTLSALDVASKQHDELRSVGEPLGDGPTPSR